MKTRGLENQHTLRFSRSYYPQQVKLCFRCIYGMHPSQHEWPLGGFVVTITGFSPKTRDKRPTKSRIEFWGDGQQRNIVTWACDKRIQIGTSPSRPGGSD